MNYPIERLDECIFDYLVSNMNEPKSFIDIWTDIRQEYGYRCSHLCTPTQEMDNEFKFYNICYTIDSNFKNIKKIYVHDTLYLVFTPETDIDFLKRDLAGNATGFPDDEALLNYIMDVGKNIKCKYMFSGSLMEHVIKTCKYDLLDRLIKIWGVSFYDDGNRIQMLKTSLKNPNIDIVTLIVDTYFVQPINLCDYNFTNIEVQYVEMARELLKQKNITKQLNKDVKTFEATSELLVSKFLEIEREYKKLVSVNKELNFDNGLLIKSKDRYFYGLMLYLCFVIVCKLTGV